MTSDSSQVRLGVLGIAALSLFGALFGRLWFLQVVSASSFQKTVAKHATTTVIEPAPRGRILDRSGIVLVDNQASLVVSIDTVAYRKLTPKRQASLLDRLAVDLTQGQPGKPGVTVKFLKQRLNDQRFSHLSPVPVASGVPESLVIFLKERADEFPSVIATRETVREYPYGRLAAQVLGYVGAVNDQEWAYLKHHNLKDKPYQETDQIGKSGVEASFEKYLRGTPGRIVYEVDRAGNPVRKVSEVPARPGDDVYLNLDAKVQLAAEKSLQSGLIRARGHNCSSTACASAPSGATAIVDPSGGQVRAMASYPTYNPSELVGGISQRVWTQLQASHALNNLAIQGDYPPGSTYKIATAYAAVKLGVLDPTQTIYDPGYYVIHGCTPPTSKDCRKTDAGGEVGGQVDLGRAITLSSDVYFYAQGDAIWRHRDTLGEDAQQKEIEVLGYGAKTGVDLPAESAGRVPTPQWKKAFSKAINGTATANARAMGRWTSGDSVNLAIGQGDALATPLQIANAYAALSNGGNLYHPEMVEKVTVAHRPNSIIYQPKPRLIRHIDWPEPAYALMLSGFKGVVTPGQGGTASATFAGFPLDSWPMLGKTGTAQNSKDPKTHLNRQDTSLFVGCGPLPSVTWCDMTVMEYAGAGADAAAPAVRRVLEPIANGDQLPLPKGGSFDAAKLAKQIVILTKNSKTD